MSFKTGAIFFSCARSGPPGAVVMLYHSIPSSLHHAGLIVTFPGAPPAGQRSHFSCGMSQHLLIGWFMRSAFLFSAPTSAGVTSSSNIAYLLSFQPVMVYRPITAFVLPKDKDEGQSLKRKILGHLCAVWKCQPTEWPQNICRTSPPEEKVNHLPANAETHYKCYRAKPTTCFGGYFLH